MKRNTLILVWILTSSWHGHAQLILDEPFAYPDGALTNVSGGTWTNHQGVLGPVVVVNEQASLDEAGRADVNRTFDAVGLTNGWLYASFVVDFSTLPGMGDAYFWHLKDAGNFAFRAKVFATQAGAGANSFRLGVANVVNAPTYAPVDLELNTPHAVVVRYDAAGEEPTVLWINPVNEASTARRAVATDLHDPVAVTAVALRQARDIGLLTVDDLKVGLRFEDVFTSGNPATNPPAISVVADQFVPVNASTPELPVTVEDQESPGTNLVLSADSSNLALLPLSGILLGGSDTNRTVTITPAAGQEGVGDVTLTVTDPDGNSASRIFTVTVGAPTIAAVLDFATPTNTPLTGIPVEIGDAEEESGHPRTDWQLV